MKRENVINIIIETKQKEDVLFYFENMLRAGYKGLNNMSDKEIEKEYFLVCNEKIKII